VIATALFEPKLIEKHQTRFEGFDAKILSMYALGMTVRDIQGHLHDMYGVDVSVTVLCTPRLASMWKVRSQYWGSGSAAIKELSIGCRCCKTS
jgi:transposase-like protein